MLCHFAGTVRGRPGNCSPQERFPHKRPLPYIRTPIARELLPAGAGSFYLLKLGSHVPDCYSASLPIGTPRGCFFIWSNQLLPKAGRQRAGALHIQREHTALPFCRDYPGSPGNCSPQERFPPQTPRDLRSQTGFAGRLRAGGLHIIEGTQGFAILQGLSGVARELLSAGAVPPQTPPPLYMHADRQKIALGRCIGKNYLTKSDKFTVRSLIHSFSFTTWW